MPDIPSNIIYTAADCTVKQFEQCCFEHKYRVLLIDGDATDDELKAAFEYIYAQYVDFSGLFQSREFEMCAYINTLDTRIQTVKRFLELQRIFIEHFNVPFVPGFDLIKKYGHNLWWNHDSPDLSLFNSKLRQIEMREKKYESVIESKVKELVEFRAKREKKEFSLLETRKSFITMVNRLQQERFVIEKRTTTVEELSLMIKDHRDLRETEKIAKTNKRN
jgi:hypothetical protein